MFRFKQRQNECKPSFVFRPAALSRFSLVILIALLLSATGPHVQAAIPVLNPQLSGTNAVGDEPRFRLSPDGSRVVYVASIGAPNRLFSAPTDGSAPPVPLNAIVNFASTVHNFAISPDGSRVVYVYGAISNGPRELYSVPITGGEPTRLNGPLPAFSSVLNFQISPDSSRVVYRADLFVDQMFELLSVPLAGGANLRLNKPPVAGGSVRSDFIISPNSEQVVYRADLDTEDTVELYRSAIAASGSTRLSADLTLNGDVIEFAISPDSNRVVYSADQAVDEQNELYAVPLEDDPIPVKLNQPLVANGSVQAFTISPNSNRVVYVADAETQGRDELYSVGINGGAAGKLNGPLAGFNGRVLSDFAVSADNRWVVYRADLQDDDNYELYASPLLGGGWIGLDGPAAADKEASAFQISPDGTHVVYRSDQAADGVDELYRVRLPLSGNTDIAPTPLKLNDRLILNGNVNDFLISPDSSRVIYEADQNVNDRFELYNVPMGGGSVTKLNGPLVDGGDVSTFAFTSDSRRVVYRADQISDDSYALFAVYESTPTVTIDGPKETLPIAQHDLLVSLNEALALSNAAVMLEVTGGDAVAGADYLLYEQKEAAAAEGAEVASESIPLTFWPNVKHKNLIFEVLPNPARNEPRTLELSLTTTNGVDLGMPSSITLTLAPSPADQPGEPGEPGEPDGYRIYLPLTRGN